MGKESRLRMTGLSKDDRVQMAQERERKRREEETKRLADAVTARMEEIQRALELGENLKPPSIVSSRNRLPLAEIARKFASMRELKNQDDS